MNSTAAIKTAHERLRAAFPANWSAESDRLAKSELEHMFSEFGERRTVEAVMTFIRSAKFFSVAELREFVPPPTETGLKLYDPNCPHCDDGWEEVWFDDMCSQDKNKILKLHPLPVAKAYTVRRRCSVCWRGNK